MYLLGLFVSAQFPATKNPADLADLDFFPFPTLGTQYDAEKALDAPIDTWQIAAKSPNLAAELDAAKAYLEFWSKGSTQLIMFQNQPGLIPTATDTDTSTYSDLQKKAVEIVGAGPEDHPVPRPRHALRLRRRERHAELPPEVPGQPDPGPGRLPEDHPGLLGSACPRSDLAGPSYPDAMSGPIDATRRHRPARSPDRRGGCRSAPPKAALLAADPAGQDDAGPDGRDPDLPVPVLHLGADDRLDRPVVHELARDHARSRPRTSSASRTTRRCSPQYPLFWPAVWHNLMWLVVLRLHRDADRHLPRGPARPRDARHPDLPERVLHPGRPVAGHRRVHLGAACTRRRASSTASSGTRARTPRSTGWATQPQHLGRPGRGQLAARRLRHGPVPGRAQERRPDAPRSRRRSTARTPGRRSSGSSSR